MTTRTCRVCGCTDDNACVSRRGIRCHWVSPDLCSLCWKKSTSAAILCGPTPPSEADLEAVKEFAAFLREKGSA